MGSFRKDARDWLERNCPASIRTPMPANEYVGGGRRASYRNPESKQWLDVMAEKGWTVPTWPIEYGGGGLETDAHLILQEELRRINARPPLQGMGISMIGPALLEFGTEEQKREHLPKIARGEIWWCQGYSEPNAGSDLASLQTRAVEDGDEYVINGSKIWTSGADQADWIFCLVRTDPAASKHEGITFILFDIDQPGVTVKPILLIVTVVDAGQPGCRLDRPGLCRRRVGHDPSVAAFEGQFDRRRHLRGAAQHSRQACSGAAGLTNALLGTLGSSMGLVEHRVASVT